MVIGSDGLWDVMSSGDVVGFVNEFLLSLITTDKKNAGSANSSRNLWVSGMSMSTKANDLKHLFSKYGRVSDDF